MLRKRICRKYAFKKYSRVIIVIQMNQKIKVMSDKAHFVFVLFEAQFEYVAGHLFVLGAKVLHQRSRNEYICK